MKSGRPGEQKVFEKCGQDNIYNRKFDHLQQLIPVTAMSRLLWVTDAKKTVAYCFPKTRVVLQDRLPTSISWPQTEERGGQEHDYKIETGRFVSEL